VSAAAPLAGLTVLVTRPAEQADALCLLLEARGARVQRLPLLTTEPARAAPALLQRFDQHRSAEGWIFTSANAVRHARRLDPGAWPARLYAVGAATAAALAELGCSALIPPRTFSGEGLLEHRSLQQVAGQRFLVVTGADGLGHIVDGLQARGAAVEVAEVYRRVALPHAPAQLEALLRPSQAILLTSGEALAQLWRLTPVPLQPELLGKRLAVPSARVVEQALALGFEPPLLPEQVSDAAFVRCLEHWWTQPGPT